MTLKDVFEFLDRPCLTRTDLILRYSIGERQLSRWISGTRSDRPLSRPKPLGLPVSFPQPVYLVPNSPRWRPIQLLTFEYERDKAKAKAAKEAASV